MSDKAFVVERNDGVRLWYWDGGANWDSFTTEHMDAIRFARYRDAHRVWAAIRVNCENHRNDLSLRVEEHMWLDEPEGGA